MTEPELRERGTAFHKALAAAQQQASGCAIAVYALTTADGPYLMGGDSVQYLDAAGRPVEEIDADRTCELMALLVVRVERLKQQYADLFGAGFSVNLQRMVAERLAATTEAGLQPFEQAVADLGKAYAPAIVIGATMAHATAGGPMPGSSMATVSAPVEHFYQVSSALAALQISLERILAGAAERSRTPLEEARAQVELQMDELRRMGDFGGE